MTPEEINSRITEWCQIDDEFAEFIKNCNKVYWMYDEEKVYELIQNIFSSQPVGAITSCTQMIREALHFESTKKIGYGIVHIFKDYFIDEEDLFIIWKHMSDYAKDNDIIISTKEAYGYPKDSSPKLGLPYNVNFLIVKHGKV